MPDTRNFGLRYYVKGVCHVLTDISPHKIEVRNTTSGLKLWIRQPDVDWEIFETNIGFAKLLPQIKATRNTLNMRLKSKAAKK